MAFALALAAAVVALIALARVIGGGGETAPRAHIDAESNERLERVLRDAERVRVEPSGEEPS